MDIKAGRLSIDGPDGSGEYEIEMEDGHGGKAYTFLNRQQADVLIVALGGTPPLPESPIAKDSALVCQRSERA